MNRNPKKKKKKNEKDRRDRLNVTSQIRDMARESGRKLSREEMKIGVN